MSEQEALFSFMTGMLEHRQNAVNDSSRIVIVQAYRVPRENMRVPSFATCAMS